MKSESSSSHQLDAAVRGDAELRAFTRSILEAARAEFGDRFVTDTNAKGPSKEHYTETHYALAAVLLFLTGDDDRRWLDLAASRLRLWDDAGGPMTFFNAMAVCLVAIALRRSGLKHDGLDAILSQLLSRACEDRYKGYSLNCGNNAYLQQVAVATVLLPLAREEQVTSEGLNCLVSEFRNYRTAEGFFYDLPRTGTSQEPLCPPTYIMKMLFLLGVCHELSPNDELAGLFRSGMSSLLPLLSRDGHVSYFGRTDNSPFAAGLTIFNLRKAARLCPDERSAYDEVGAAAERYYETFPRTSSGVLRSNRFGEAASAFELNWSKDDYAYDGQYSLASCAYALLGCHWFPTAIDQRAVKSARQAPVAPVVLSKDLGLAKVRGSDSELIVRTGSELTGLDRRYLGPTILRYQVNGHLLVGAISRTVSTDAIAQTHRPTSRAGRAYELLRRWFVDGIEQLDGTSVGFLPVLRQGPVDYLPYTAVAQEVSPSQLRTRYQMVRLRARGYRHCGVEALELFRARARREKEKPYRRPSMKLVDSIELLREVHLEPGRCRIEDRVSGDLHGKKLLFSIRHLPGAVVRLRGLRKVRSMTGWGSDGRQTLELYEAPSAASEILYGCDIEPATRPAL